MALVKKPFVRYSEEKRKNLVVPLSLNEDEQKILASSKDKLQQPKDSTTIKQLMKIGAKYIHSEPIGTYINIVLDNKRKNKRLGIVDFD